MRRRAVCLSAVVGLAACGTHPPPPTPSQLSSNACTAIGSAVCGSSGLPPGLDVVNAGLITPTTGWALSADALSISHDGGRTWQRLTGLRVTPSAVLSVVFAGMSNGWLVTSQDGVHVQVQETSDGGATWRVVQLPPQPPGWFPLRAYAYLSGRYGWIAVEWTSTQRTERSVVYASSDGGHTFRQASLPAAAPLNFVNADLGFTTVTSGLGAEVTPDGGATWRTVRLPAPPGPAQATFGGDFGGLSEVAPGALPLPVLNAGSTRPTGLAVYSLQPGGAGFTLDGAVAFGLAYADSLAVSTSGGGAVVAVVNASAPNTVVTFSSDDAGAHFQRVSGAAAHGGQVVSILSASQLAHVSFAGTEAGWAVATFSVCLSAGTLGGEQDCHSKNLLFGTSDAGATWSLLSPP